jgi:hypothetical protein
VENSAVIWKNGAHSVTMLRQLKAKPDEDGAVEADVLSRTLTLQKKRKAFKKRPDEPLGIVIKQKLARRNKLE